MLRTLFTAPKLTKCIRQPLALRIPQPIINREFRTTISKHNRYIRFSDPPNPGGGHQRPKGPLNWRTWDPPVKFGVGILVFGGVYYVAHLEQVPQTGRWRFMNTSSRTEASLGEAMREQLTHELAGKILPPNHPISLHVRRVASRILRSSNLGRIHGETSSIPLSNSPFGFGDEVWTPKDDYGAAARHSYGPEKEWDVVVVHDPKVINAMAAPGLIMVFSGLLPVCQDEQGLAAVLSHEIGHVVARHTAERVSSQAVMMALVIALQALGLDWGLSSLVRTFLLELPNSRTQEFEADLIGLRLMSRACYDPAASPQMFERMGRIEAKMGSRGLDFFQTHPSSERRVKQLEEVLPEAYSILAANPECAALRDRLEEFRDNNRAVRINANREIEYA